MFWTAAAELCISMIRKKSWAIFLSTLKSSVPLVMSSPVFATATTTGAEAMLREEHHEAPAVVLQFRMPA